MKILFITDNFPPEVNAPATRTYEHCVEWVRQGAEVTVITCVPNFPEGKVFEGYRNKLCQQEVRDGIRVIRVWSYITANEGFAKRVVDYVSFAFMAFWAGLFRSFDVIIATSPQFFTTFSGCALSFIRRKPWVFELRDLWPESIATVGAMKPGRLLRLLEKIELFMYRNADLVVPVTWAFQQNLERRGILGDKITVIPNGANLELFQPCGKDTELAARLGLADKFVIGYIGTHGMAHGLDFIMRACRSLDDSTIHFLFIGAGAAKADTVKLAAELNITNVTFLDPIPKDQVRRYMSITDVALVPLRRSDTFKTVIPSKIFETAAMRKPILLGVDGQAREIVEEFGAGLYFEPENEQAFLAAVRKLAADHALYAQLQTGCGKLAQAYNRKNLAQKMYQDICHRFLPGS
jgi:glycosyltransferase involved in cell wall biosynthesis